MIVGVLSPSLRGFLPRATTQEGCQRGALSGAEPDSAPETGINVGKRRDFASAEHHLRIVANRSGEPETRQRGASCRSALQAGGHWFELDLLRNERQDNAAAPVDPVHHDIGLVDDRCRLD